MTFLIELYETFKPVLVGPAILLVLCLMAWGSEWMADPESFEGFMQALGVAIVILVIAGIYQLYQVLFS